MRVRQFLFFSILACSALALGGCSSSVMIGSDDGGTSRDAGPATDGSNGEPCGANTCTDGLVCCNASCGICAPPDVDCTTIACTEPVVCQGEVCESDSASCCPGCFGDAFCSGPDGVCPAIDCPAGCTDDADCGPSGICCVGCDSDSPGTCTDVDSPCPDPFCGEPCGDTVCGGACRTDPVCLAAEAAQTPQHR